MKSYSPGKSLKPRTPSTRLLTAPRLELLPLPGTSDHIGQIPAGSTATVTSSPRSGVEATIGLVEELSRHGLDAVPHLAARQFGSESELTGVLARLHQAGVRDIFVIGGDRPSAAGSNDVQGSGWPTGSNGDDASAFPDGIALLEAIATSGYEFEQIGVAAYPEGHPSIDSATLEHALRVKQHYATYAVTQMCFDAASISSFAAMARAAGITLPLIAGVPGPVTMPKLLRISLRIGVGDSLSFVRGHRSIAQRLLRPRGYRPDSLLRRLDQLDRSTGYISGVHIYTFNEVGPTLEWLERGGHHQEAVIRDDYAV